MREAETTGPRSPGAPSPVVPRLHSLDVLRAVAVLLVIGRHLTVDPTRWSPGLGAAALLWQRGGWVGVDLFFVLSGFLVSGLLFREYRERGTTRIGRFLLRRGLKIYPGFYLMLAATVVQRLLKGGFEAAPPAAIASEALFVQNYGARLLAHTWSLDVEEHFYLLCSLLLFVLARRGRRAEHQADPFGWIPAIFGVIAVVCLAARLATAAARPTYEAWTHSFPTHLRVDGLMFGVCLSYLYNFHVRRLDGFVRRHRWVACALGAALLVPAFLFPLESTPALYTWGYTVFYLGSGLLVLGLVVGDLRPTAFVRVVAFVGGCSYSIYLWHWMAHALTARVFERFFHTSGSPAELAVYFVLSFAFGIGTAKLIELPVIRLRDRLIPSRTQAVAAPSLSR